MNPSIEDSNGRDDDNESTASSVDKNNTGKSKKKGGKKVVKKSEFKSLAKAQVTTLAASDGHELKDDIIVTGIEDALQRLQLDLMTACAATKEKRRDMWDMTYVPLSAFDASRDDLYRAYLRWSQTPERRQLDQYNVTKTIRRLEQFTRWFYEHGPELELDPADPGGDLFRTVSMMAERMKLYISPHVAQSVGAILLCMDVKGAVALGEAVPPRTMMRVASWLTLRLSLDPQVQEHGVCFIQNLRFISFFTMQSIIDLAARRAANELIQGCSAIKMKRMMVVNAPWWMRTTMNFFKMFMNKKMRARLLVMGADHSSLHQEVHVDSLPLHCLGGRNTGSCRYFGRIPYTEADDTIDEQEDGGGEHDDDDDTAI